MKVLAVESKDVHVTLEFPVEQIKKIIQFNNQALPLFDKVFGEEEELGNFIEDGYTKILEKLLEDIDDS